MPKPISLDPKDPTHYEFLLSAAHLFAYALDIEVPSETAIKTLISDMYSKFKEEEDGESTNKVDVNDITTKLLSIS